MYRARDESLNRDVAIKVLPASFAQDADRLRRFEQEAHAISALNHPNILTVYDVGTYDGTPFFVSELLDGEELRDSLDEAPIPLRKAIDYAQQIVSGLSAAHEKGIVHRDLKPENLFLTKDDRVKILDFGLAKLSEPGAVATGSEDATRKVLTNPGVIMGTVGYMSPEQVRGEKIDHRSDIFSFGAILHEMITGRRAFRRETMAETMTAILKEEPEELSESNPNINPVAGKNRPPLSRKETGAAFSIDIRSRLCVGVVVRADKFVRFIRKCLDDCSECSRRGREKVGLARASSLDRSRSDDGLCSSRVRIDVSRPFLDT